MYDWAPLETGIQEAVEANLEIVGRVYGYALADSPSPYPLSEHDAKLGAYESFIRALVQRYKGRIRFWQIENEVTQDRFWDAPLATYIDVLKTAYRAIKSEDDSAQVLMAGFVPIPYLSLDELEFLLREGAGHFDILDIHSYEPPGDMVVQIGLMKEYMDRLDLEQPLWMTETGGPHPGHYQAEVEPPPDAQASEVLKRYAAALAAGVERVFWLQIDPERIPNNEWPGTADHPDASFVFMALTRHGKPRPAFTTYLQMTETLEGYRSVDQTDLGPGVLSYRFTKPAGDVYILWSERGTIEIDLPAEARVSDSLFQLLDTGTGLVELSDQVVLVEVPAGSEGPSISTADSADVAVPRFEEVKSWDFAAGLQGWKANFDISNLAITEEGLEFNSIGSDPWIEGPAMDYPTGLPLRVTIRMKSDAPQSAQLFYGRPTFSEAASTRFSVTSINLWNEYVILVPAQGSATRFRLDPANTPGHIVISQILVDAVESTQPPLQTTVPHVGEVIRWDFASGLQGWTGNFDTEELAPTDQGLEFESVGNDPWITGPQLYYPEGVSLIVTMRIKSNADGFGQLFYGGVPSQGFSEEASARFVIIHDASWHEYSLVIPPQEPGSLIRLDPATSAGHITIAWIRIDYIV